MAGLEGPMEFYEWGPGEERTFTVLKWEKGTHEIHPGDRAVKSILVIRIHVPPGEKPAFPHYWDMGAGRITGQLLPLLEATPRFPVKIRIKADRYPAPKTHYEVHRLPA